MVDNPEKLVARGAVGALTKVAKKRDYQQEKVVEHLTSVIIDKSKPFTLRQDAYLGLKELGVTNVSRPWPTIGDIKRVWSNFRRPVIAVLTVLLLFFVLNATVWEPANSKFFFDDLNTQSIDG